MKSTKNYMINKSWQVDVSGHL